MQRGLDSIQKLNGQAVICPVSEKCHGFADDIPCCKKRDMIRYTVFEEFTGLVVIRITWVERCKKK